jgi:mannose-6-phosphate isomerase-like protein (cupin superfamily)
MFFRRMGEGGLFVGPLLPIPGGLHVLVLTLPPNLKRDASAMHSTPSVDCIMQVSGESVFVMEDTEVHLLPGDWLISNGVTHSWRNDLNEPSIMIGVVYGAPIRQSPTVSD